MKPKHILVYYKKLMASNLIWGDNSILGMTALQPVDIFINLSNPDHSDPIAVRRTLTHEVVHRVHVTPPIEEKPGWEVKREETRTAD